MGKDADKTFRRTGEDADKTFRRTGKDADKKRMGQMTNKKKEAQVNQKSLRMVEGRVTGGGKAKVMRPSRSCSS